MTDPIDATDAEVERAAVSLATTLMYELDGLDTREDESRFVGALCRQLSIPVGDVLVVAPPDSARSLGDRVLIHNVDDSDKKAVLRAMLDRGDELRDAPLELTPSGAVRDRRELPLRRRVRDRALDALNAASPGER